MAITDSKANVRPVVRTFFPAFSLRRATNIPNKKQTMMQHDITLESMMMPIPKAFIMSKKHIPAS